MNNNIFDFKKKIAFAAALVFVANSFGNITASAASSIPKNVNSNTYDADENDEENNEGADGDAEEDVPEIPLETTTAVTTTTTSNETTVTTTTTTQQTKTEYTIVVNGGITQEDFLHLVSVIFNGNTYEYSNITPNGGTVSVASGTPVVSDDIYDGGTKYTRVSAADRKLVYDTYYKVTLPDNIEHISVTGIPENGYCKSGSEIILTPDDEYTLVGSGEAKNVKVAQPLNFSYTSNGGEDYRISCEGSSYIISPRMFSLTLGAYYQVYRGSEITHDREFKWKDINDISIKLYGKQAVVISDGDTAQNYELDGDTFQLSKLLEKEQFRYSNDAQFIVTAVNWKINVKSTFEGEPQKTVTRSFHVEKDNSGNYFFRVPYLELGNYYLSGYEYASHQDVDMSEMMSDLKKSSGAVGYYKIPYDPDKDDIELIYKKFSKFGDSTFAPASDLSLRSGNCYTLDGSVPTRTLMTFPESFDNGFVSYEYYGGAGSSSVKTSNSFIVPDNREFKLNTAVIRDPAFILVKNIIKDGESTSSGMDDCICFYNDKNAPSVSRTDGHDDNTWFGRRGAVYTLDIDDTEKCPIEEKDTVFYEEKEIQEVYDKFINAPTENKQEIAAVIVGDYRFDRPANGWGDTASIRGYIETSAVRSAEAALVNELRTIELSEVNADKYSDQGDDYNYYKGIISSSLFSELKTYYNDKIADAEEDEADELKSEYSVISRRIDAYTSAVSAAANTHNTIPTLTFDTDQQQFRITFRPEEAYKNSLITENVKVYAVDNSGNSGFDADKVLNINVKIDCASPVFEGNKAWIENSVAQLETDGVKNYVVVSGNIIKAEINDLFGDEEGSGVSRAEWYIGDDSSSAKPMVREGDSNIFIGYITDEDVSDKNFKENLTIKAYDEAENPSVLSSDSASPKFNIIVDTTRPVSYIYESSPADKVYHQYTDGGDKSWYRSFDDIRIGISANDFFADICSGVRYLSFEINGRDCPVDVEYDELDAEKLRQGKYYIAFEQGSEKDSFAVYLRDSDNSDFSIDLCRDETYLLGRRDDGSYDDSFESGSINIKFHVKDRALNESLGSEMSVYLDLDAPAISDAQINGTGILRGENSFRYEAFSDNEAELRIFVGDNAPSSGIAEVRADLLDSEGNVYAENINAERDGNDWIVRVPVNFKGSAMLRAYDNVGKSSELAYTLGIVTEDSNKHSEEDHVWISLDDTPYTDINGLPLYTSDVHAVLTVSDTFSGIYEMFTDISGTGEKRAAIDRSANFSDEDSEEWYASDGSDNLVTEARRDVVISDNSNGSSISLRMTDQAGNPHYDDVAYAEFSIDKTKPVINVAFSDGNNSGDSEYRNIYRSNRKAVITITERNFDKNKAEVMLNGRRQTLEWRLSEGTEGTDSAKYRAELPVEGDGTYKLVVNCRDTGDLRADTYDSGEFIIDTTPPTFGVSFDKGLTNEHYYSDEVTATFRISDANLDTKRVAVSGTVNGRAENFVSASDWIKSGNDYIARVKFDVNGEYEVNVSAKDKAGNTMETYSGGFVIDTQKPEIGFADVKKSNNGKEIRPTIVFNDQNISKDSIKVELYGANRGKTLDIGGELNEKKGGYEYVLNNIPAKPEYDDIYTLKATAEDNASNKIEKKIRFSVNRFGSTFLLDKETEAINGRYVSKPKDIVITEYNADKHAKEHSVFITRDSEMTELKEGKDYIVDVKGGGDEWTEYRYTIFSNNFVGDARYTVSIHSVDEAGNINVSDSDKKNAEVSFCVDKTKPLCIPLNIADNRTYKGESYTARLSVSDNIVLKNIRVYVDGLPVTTRLDDDECTFNIPNSGHAREINVVLTDMAGNEEEYNYKNILVTTNILRLLIRKTWFKITAGAALLLAGAAVVFFRRRKKRLL